jgi:hypothetical protein
MTAKNGTASRFDHASHPLNDRTDQSVLRSIRLLTVGRFVETDESTHGFGIEPLRGSENSGMHPRRDAPAPGCARAGATPN